MNQKITEEITSYFNTKPDIVAVYLFGSHAEGKEQPESDIDIGILFDANRLVKAKKKLDEYIPVLSRILRKDIHPVILNSAGEILLQQIFQKGICVLAKDPKALAHYKMIQFTKIADFAYYKNLMQSGLIHNVMVS